MTGGYRAWYVQSWLTTGSLTYHPLTSLTRWLLLTLTSLSPQELAMREFKHVWIDGSLRDGAWYLQHFADLKQRHPAYRIAIIHVVASEDEILERVRR